MRLTDIADQLQSDWVPLARQLGFTQQEIVDIQKEYTYVGEQVGENCGDSEITFADAIITTKMVAFFILAVLYMCDECVLHHHHHIASPSLFYLPLHILLLLQLVAVTYSLASKFIFIFTFTYGNSLRSRPWLSCTCGWRRTKSLQRATSWRERSLASREGTSSTRAWATCRRSRTTTKRWKLSLSSEKVRTAPRNPRDSVALSLFCRRM